MTEEQKKVIEACNVVLALVGVKANYEIDNAKIGGGTKNPK